MDKNNISDAIAFLMIGTVAGAGLMWAGMTYGGNNTNHGEYPEFAEIAEARTALEENGVSFNAEKAVNGYVKGGLDQFSRYISSEADELPMDEYVNTSGTALASGFKVARADSGTIILTSVDEDKAAYACGLRAGDEIISIDGTDIAAEGFEHSANLLLGKQDSECDIVIKRNGAVQDLTFRRDNDPMSAIEFKDLNGTGYIRFMNYNGLSGENLQEALKELNGSVGYIIDLRADLEAGPEVCAELLGCLAPGETIVSTAYNGFENTWTAETAENTLGAPAVILVNRNTSRGGEALAAAMKHHYKDAVIIGERTAGEASYQKMIDLPSGGQIYYTEGTFHIEGIDLWDGTGILPDQEIEMDPGSIGTEKDIQLQRAIKLLD